ncbi:hypothetical protein [Paenarthrobacter sp. C1]|uniref:hypothetical protein n=1 Tax=Paenarthrobacter sp. C1 TaxID=3400220 RepID=UPI003BF460DD
MGTLHLSPNMNKRRTLNLSSLRLNNSAALAQMERDLTQMEGRSQENYERLMREVSSALARKKSKKGK